MKDLEKTEAPEWGTEFPKTVHALRYTQYRDTSPYFHADNAEISGSEGEFLRNKGNSPYWLPSEDTGSDVNELIRSTWLLRVYNGAFHQAATFKKGRFVGQVCGKNEEFMNRPHSQPRVTLYEKGKDEADYLGVMASAFWLGKDWYTKLYNDSYTAPHHMYANLPKFKRLFEGGPLSSLERISEEYRANEHIRELVKFSIDQLQDGKNGVICVPDSLLAQFQAKSSKKPWSDDLILFFTVMEIIQGEDDFCIFGNQSGSNEPTANPQLGMAEELRRNQERDYERYKNEIAILNVPKDIAPLETHTELARLVDDLIMKEGIEGLRKRLHEGKAVTGRQKRFAKLFPGNPAFKEDPPKVVPPPKPVEAQRSSVGDNIRSGLKKFFGSI